MTPAALTLAPPPRHVAETRRLCAAPRGGTLVERRRLLQPLADASALALLVAPAGYGKTTLLRQWSERDTHSFTWMAAGAPDAGEALQKAISRWAASRRGAVLVVDDAHLLEDRARDGLAAAARASGPGHVLAISSRSDPGLPLGRLRAEDRLVEIGPHLLAMTDHEAALLLRRAGAPQDPAAVTMLQARTEGWPAALHLAALALREGGASLDRFAGDDRYVADYLRDEVLSALTPEQLDFLRQTSVLDRLSGPLCDAVAHRERSAELLGELARANVMLTPIDRAEQHFRLHPLFADMLRSDAQRLDPAQITRAHQRASAWHEEQGDIDRAIDHAISAGNLRRTTRLLWSVTERCAIGGEATALGIWLARLPAAELSERPALALGHAVERLAHGDGDQAEHWADVAAAAIGEAPANGPLAPALLVVRSAVGRDGLAAMAGDAGQAYELAAAEGPWRPPACFLAGAARQLGEDPEGGRRLLEEGVRRAGPAPGPVRMLCLAQLAAAALAREDHLDAVALAAEARAAIGGDTLSEDPAAALVHAVCAAALAHEGAADRARSHAATALALLDEAPSPPAWFAAEVRLFLARAQLRLSDAEQAREHLTRAGRDLRAIADAVTLQDWIEDAWSWSDSFAEGSVVGLAMLTPAELRVLRFLPSHLSFREIATRLHVSTNTVKTQAHAIYRKLDASSRSEAVHRARAVGLVDA